MPETTQTATSVTPTPAGPSSTPAAAASATPAPSTPASPAPAAAAPVTEAAPPNAPAASPPATEAPAVATPLIALPPDMKLAPAAIEKFDSALRPKLSADGKVTVTPQEIADLFFDQARDASEAWKTQQSEQDAAWKAETLKRFSTAQLAARDTAIGFLSSVDPAFRELAKQFEHHPTFVNAMRTIGERLSEDTFEIGGAPPAPAKKTPAQRMGYAKSN